MKSLHTFCTKSTPKVLNLNFFSTFALAKVAQLFGVLSRKKGENRGFLVWLSFFFVSFETFFFKTFGGFKYKAYLCSILKYNRMNYETKFIKAKDIRGYTMVWLSETCQCFDYKHRTPKVCPFVSLPKNYNHYVSKSRF